MRRATRFAFFALAATLCALGYAQPVVLTAERALLVLEPRAIVTQNVLGFWLSPSGRYVVALQEVPSEKPLVIGQPMPEPKAKKLIVWDSVSGATREVPIHKDASTDSLGVQFFPGTDKALVTLTVENVETKLDPSLGPGPFYTHLRETHLLDLATIGLRKVHSFNEHLDPWTSIGTSPVLPVAVRYQHVHETFERPKEPGAPRTRRQYVPVKFQVLTPDGTWSKETALPEGYYLRGRTGWSEDGRMFQVEARRPQPGGGKLADIVIQFDPTTGTYEETIGAVGSYKEKDEAKDVALSFDMSPIGDGKPAQRLVTWWLKSTTESKDPSTLVAEHAEMAQLPQGERFVVYFANGVLFTRQVIQMTLEQYEQMTTASARTVVISNAKQMALGFLMFATDHDDTIPPGVDLERDIMPYIKNSEVMKGFVLVFQGGALKDVSNPTETVLGYIEGPGGRAVAYLDGHVKWETNGGG